MLQLFRRLFGGPEPELEMPLERARLTGQWTRLPWDGHSYELDLLDDSFLLTPEEPVDSDGRTGDRPIVLRNRAHLDGRIAPRLRILQGDRITLSPDDPAHDLIIEDPRGVGRRKLEIRHAGAVLMVRDRVSELDAFVGPAEPPALLEDQRIQALHDLIRLYGGPIRPLDPATALASLQRANEILRRASLRSIDVDGNPGAIVTLPPEITPILVGDLHGLVDNLLRILSVNGFLAAMQRGDAAMILIGDTIHREDDDAIGEMGSSLLMTDLVVRLKLAFPDRFFMLLGNHESFLPAVMKAGVAQGLLWKRYVIEHRGQQYCDALASFYELSPVVVQSTDFLSCHAAPARGAISRQLIDDVRQHPAKLRQLITDRARGPGYPTGYTKGDVKRFRKAFGLPKDAPFIVGHYPRQREHAITAHVDGIPNHHVLFSALHHEVGVFTRVRGRMVGQTYGSERVLRWMSTHADKRQLDAG